MKKYSYHCPSQGQSLASRIAYYEKVGIAQGINKIIKRETEDRGLSLDNWQKKIIMSDTGMPDTEVEIPHFSMVVIIPTPNNYKELRNYPMFTYNGNVGYIDMLCVQSSNLQFHIMLYDFEHDTFANGKWHFVAGNLSLDDVCTLFEYVEDRIHELIILSSKDSDMFNNTGALGVTDASSKKLRANGKNLIMFKYQTQDYMDASPSISFKTIESQELMNQWVAHMRKTWSGGTISNGKIVTPKGYYEARQSSYWKGYEEKLDKLTLDCTQEWLDEYSNLLNQ